VASRRRVPIGEIDGGRSADVARVLAVLVDGRLLTVDDGHVEPAHEALLREWPRMRQWLEEDAQARRIREHLVRTAGEWAGTGRQPGELYRGQRLGAAVEWASVHGDELNDVERDFLDASRQASEADLARQRRINVRLRGLLGAAAVLLVVAVIAGVVAVRQADVAQASADYARVRELSASSRIADLADPSLGRLLAVATADLLPADVDTESVLHEAWLADAVLQRVPKPAGRSPGLVANVDPAGTRLAEVWGHEGDGPSEVEVVDLDTGRTAWTYRSPTPGAVIDQAFFSLDGSRVVTSLMWVDEDHDPPAGELGILVFEAATGKPIEKIDVGPCGTLLTGVSAAGYLIVEPSAEGVPTCYAGDNPVYEGDFGRAVALVDPTTGTARTVAEDNLGDVMVSRDGRVLAYSSTDEFAVLVDLATGAERVRVHAPTTFPQLSGLFRAISADGALALFGDRPEFVIDTATGKEVASLRAGEGENWGQAFALVGDLAFTSGRDAVLRAWDARTGAHLFAVPGVAGGTVLATLDGRALVVDENDTITVTDPRARGEAAEFRTCRGFYPGGSLKVVGGRAFLGGGCARGGRPLYRIDLTGTPVQDWRLGNMEGQHFAVSSDGTRIARELHDTFGLEIVDATTGRQITRLDGTCTFDETVYSLNDRWRAQGCRRFPAAPFPFWAVDLQFAPDGSLLAGLDDAGYLVAWDTATGRIVAAIDPGGWAGVLFTPDGQELIVGTKHGAMLVYSTATWELLREVAIGESVDGSLSPVAFLDGGRTLLVAGGIRDEIGASVYRLDASTFEVLGSVDAHTANLKAVAVSQEGTQLATAGADGSVRVWDAGTLTLEHELRVPGQAQGVAFVDEQHLAVTPQAGDILVMILDRDELLSKVRSTLTRGFTADECVEFGFGSACPTLEEMRGGAPSP
jgi:WD40 repeat protein